MIDLTVRNGEVELAGYSKDATLSELKRAVETSRTDPSLVTAHCAGCGRCCYFEHLPLFGFDLIAMRERRGQRNLSEWVKYPACPDIDERRHAIADFMRQHDLDRTTAALLYEFNVAEPISYAKSPSGGCVFLCNGFCGNYEGRAYTCALYSCTMGPELSSLQERIVRQGVWHSYFVEGWISEEEIAHNPFLSGDGYDSVPVSAFDVDLSSALESLFFYF